MNRILFSPLGKTDPISNMRDGSMLHICRIYKPNIVYLYMSSEILQDHNKDDRYVYCLRKLEEKLNHRFEIEIIERPELTDVHKLDDFYEEFSKCLQNIGKTHKGKIMLNVSSGTPAMKMTLQVLASIHPELYTAIQVGTPAKSANKVHEDTDNYDVELQWECDKDNLNDEFEDRSSHSKTASLFANIQKENIKRLVKEYDYSAALSLVENMKDTISKNAIRYLKAAEKRNLLDIEGVRKILTKDIKLFIPAESDKNNNIIEYLLNLDIKLKKCQYADYIRAITPVILDVLLAYMKKNFRIKENDFCIRKNNNIWYISIDKMKRKSPEILGILQKRYNNLRENPLSSEYVSAIILAKENNSKIYSAVEKLRNIEKKVRNYAAHQIVAITEESIQKDADIEPHKIIKLLELLAINGGIDLKEEYWSSYDRMNEKIIGEIDVQI